MFLVLLFHSSSGVNEWVSGSTNNGHGWNHLTGKMEAYKEGGSPADVKLLCGRLFKKLGKYSMKQIDKVLRGCSVLYVHERENMVNFVFSCRSALTKCPTRITCYTKVKMPLRKLKTMPRFEVW